MHDVTIGETVVAEITARRGRRHRFETIEPSRTALVVIDLQNGFMLPGMPVEVPVAREIVPNVNRLAAAMRAAGGLVCWVRMSLVGARESWHVFSDGAPADTLEAFMPGGFAYELHGELDVRPDDLVVDKHRFSAFIAGSSDLDERLRRAGVDTLVVVGTLTNVCCESTARDAMMLDYRVVLVEDANAARTDEEHLAAITNIFRTFGDVRRTEEVLGLLAAPAGITASS